MSPLDVQLLIVALVIFIAAPYLPTAVYSMLFSNMIVPTLFLIALLLVMKKSLFGSVALFLAVGSLFVENRRRTFQEVKAPTYEQQMAPADPIVPGEIHPPADLPVSTGPVLKYAPSEDSTNEFRSVGPSVNKKRVLNSISTATDANKYIIEHSLAEINLH